MEEGISKKKLWDSAGKAGAVLGAISIAYLVITTLMAGKGGALGGALLTLVLWIAKFAACIYLMKVFMLRYSAGEPSATNRDTFSFGRKTAFLSALIYSAFVLAFYTLIMPDALASNLDTVMQSYSSMLDSNSLEQLEQMKSSLPQWMFFSNLIYCYLFGCVVSIFLSRNIPSSNPFENPNL